MDRSDITDPSISKDGADSPENGVPALRQKLEVTQFHLAETQSKLERLEALYERSQQHNRQLQSEVERLRQELSRQGEQKDVERCDVEMQVTEEDLMQKPEEINTGMYV